MDEIYIKVNDLGYIDKYFKNQDLITVDRLIAKLEDLDAELEATKEELEEVREYKEQFNPYKEYGVRESDFH